MKSMLPCLVLLFLLLLSIACKKDNQQPANISIAENKCLQGNIGSYQAEICFDSVVNDSRCPVNFLCFTSGRAVAAFTFRKDNQSVSFTLSTAGTSPSPDTVIFGTYIKLVNLLPFPNGDQPQIHPDTALLNIPGFHG